jgi:TolB-like protein
MESDEAGTLKRLKSLRREIFSPMTTRFGGRIFKLTGDGALAEYSSAADAVHSAVAIQRSLAEQNAGLPEKRRTELRIGISLGDVIVEGTDLYGTGVNVAARMEGLAEPGGICISGNVYEHVGQSRDLQFVDLGEQTIKNIDRPVRCYRVQIESANVAADSAPPADSLSAAADQPSIAVLPFDNLSNDPEQEYFSDGLAEDLITDLSKISHLSVAARNSSFSFKGQMPDIKDVAVKLGVAFVLEGSVRKMGDRLRINAQLINGTDGRHIWAERYDGDMDNIFEFQDDIREQIVAALHVSLTSTDKVVVEGKPTDSAEAYDLFLKGRAGYHRYTPDDFLDAIKCLEKAIEIDPKFADAYGYLAYCHMHGWAITLSGFDDNIDQANELAERGVALDGASVIALTRLGYVQTFLRRYDQSMANLEKAFAMAPNNAEVNATFGNALNYWGNPKRGLELVEKALGLETIAPPMWQYYAGHSHFLLHQNVEALRHFELAAERAPKAMWVHLLMAGAYVELDRLDDAHTTVKKVLEISPHYNLKDFTRLLTHRIDEDRNRFLENLRRAGLPEG